MDEAQRYIAEKTLVLPPVTTPSVLATFLYYANDLELAPENIGPFHDFLRHHGIALSVKKLSKDESSLYTHQIELTRVAGFSTVASQVLLTNLSLFFYFAERVALLVAREDAKKKFLLSYHKLAQSPLKADSFPSFDFDGIFLRISDIANQAQPQLIWTFSVTSFGKRAFQRTDGASEVGWQKLILWGDAVLTNSDLDHVNLEFKIPAVSGLFA